MASTAQSAHGAGSTRRPVLGRVQELRALQAEWQRSTLGELRVALVLGEAGLGKTRLATELLPHDSARAVGLITRSGVVRGMPPFGPWADALGLHAGDSEADRVCRACGSGLGDLPPLGHRCGSTHDAVSCAQALRHHFVEWIPGLLATASADRPITVVLDDAHHADDAVWEMMLRLAQDFPASQVFILATARPAELTGNRWAREVLHALEQDARIHRVQLAPFSPGEVRELTAETLRRDRVPSALVDWLLAYAQGNPQCTVGLLEALVESGADLQAPTVSGVPERLARWIRTELARLDQPSLALAELLAVVGEPVDPDDLAQVADQPVESVARTLERLARSGTVVEQHEGFPGYALTHQLMREVLYSDIGSARRRLMHRQVAATLLEAGRPEVAASHYARAAQAGDRASVIALIEIAEQAQQRGLCLRVWQTVSTLHDLLPIGDERWDHLFDAVCQRSNWGVIDRTEHYVAEITTVRRMRERLIGVADPQRQAEIRLWLAGVFAYGAGDVDTGERECRQALALCQQIGRDAAARSAAVELAKLRGWTGDLRGEEAAAQELLNDAERARDQQGIAESLGALGHALGWQGRFDAAERALTRSLEMAAAAAHRPWMSQCLALLACLDACQGHLVSARARWAQAAASSPRYHPMIGRCGAFIELLAGDLAMVGAHARHAESHDPAVRSGLPVRLASQAAMAAAERGALTDARRNLRAMTHTDTRNFGLHEPLYWWAEGAVSRVEGRLAAASAALARAADLYSAMSAHALTSFVLADLAEVTVIVGDSDAAVSAATSADENARYTGAPVHQMLHLLATSWALIGHDRHEGAVEAASRAIEGFSSRGYLLLAARARVAYATAIRGSDPTAAGEALRAAAAAFDACGAAVRHQHANSLLMRLGSSGPDTGQVRRRPGALTRREQQVAELAASGYTAAQIATELRIGVRTVETHLARSYAKLGVSGKQQLVRHATALGLTPSP